MQHWGRAEIGKSVWQYLTKVKKYLPYHSVIPLLGIYSRKMKSHVHIRFI